MKWLAQSHKLNPSQNHRKITGDKIIANKPFTHFAELWKRLEEEWSKFKLQSSENRFSYFLVISLKTVNIKKKISFCSKRLLSLYFPQNKGCCWMAMVFEHYFEQLRFTNTIGKINGLWFVLYIVIHVYMNRMKEKGGELRHLMFLLSV